jgi:hypothetical protein
MIELSNRDTVAIPLSDSTLIKRILNIRKYNRLSDFLNSKETELFWQFTMR